MKKLFTITLSLLVVFTLLSACTQQHEYTHEDTTNTAKNEHVITTKPLLEETDDFSTYSSIVSTYRKIVTVCPRYETYNVDEHFTFPSPDARALYELVFYSTLSLYPRTLDGLNGNCYERFGYTLKDLNSDNIDELILRLDDYQIIAIFTIVNDTPVLIDHYWNRKDCWIDPNGYLHVRGSNGASQSFIQIYRIDDKTGELLLMEEYGTDGYDEVSGQTLYYILDGNKKIHITHDELDSWIQELPYFQFEVTKNIAEYLEFVPLFNNEFPAPPPYIQETKG